MWPFPPAETSHVTHCPTSGGNERLNTVPLPELPPCTVVPYSVLPDKSNPARGAAPSLLIYGKEAGVAVKLYRLVKPVPSVLRANTVPLPPLPPACAVPYRLLPHKINPARRTAPSLLVLQHEPL